MDIRHLAGAQMSTEIRNVPLAKMPHALRMAAHSLSSYLQGAGIEPSQWEQGDPGYFLCPFCSQPHSFVPDVFHGGDDPATGLEAIEAHRKVHGLDGEEHHQRAHGFDQ